MRVFIAVLVAMLAVSAVSATSLEHAKKTHTRHVEARAKKHEMPSVFAVMTQMLSKMVSLEHEVKALKQENGASMRFREVPLQETPVERELEQISAKSRFAMQPAGAPPAVDPAVPLAEGTASSGAGNNDGSSPFKCNPDGSVAVDDSQCPNTCPPCPGLAKPAAPGRTVRVVEYQAKEYPLGNPTVLFNSPHWLTPKRAKQIRAVLTGELAKKMKEMEAVMEFEQKEDGNEKVAEEISELDKMKEEVKFKHMSPDEKIVMSLEKVLDEMGVDPEAATFGELEQQQKDEAAAAKAEAAAAAAAGSAAAPSASGSASASGSG